MGRRVPAHGSALGKVFYAFAALPLPGGPLEPLAPRTSAQPDALGLDEVRARGYATAVEELEPGLWAVAAPCATDGRRRRLVEHLGPRLCGFVAGCSTDSAGSSSSRGATSPPWGTTTESEVSHE